MGVIGPVGDEELLAGAGFGHRGEARALGVGGDLDGFLRVLQVALLGQAGRVEVAAFLADGGRFGGLDGLKVGHGRLVPHPGDDAEDDGTEAQGNHCTEDGGGDCGLQIDHA